MDEKVKIRGLKRREGGWLSRDSKFAIGIVQAMDGIVVIQSLLPNDPSALQLKEVKFCILAQTDAYSDLYVCVPSD